RLHEWGAVVANRRKRSVLFEGRIESELGDIAGKVVMAKRTNAFGERSDRRKVFYRVTSETCLRIACSTDAIRRRIAGRIIGSIQTAFRRRAGEWGIGELAIIGRVVFRNRPVIGRLRPRINALLVSTGRGEIQLGE